MLKAYSCCGHRYDLNGGIVLKKRVLAVGKSRRVLRKLTGALTEAGFDARWTDDIPAASRRFRPGTVDLVAFGRGVGGQDRSRLKSAYLEGNPAVLFVDGLAPVIPLLVAQVESAFSSQNRDSGVLEHVTASDGGLAITARDDCDLEVTLYRLDRLYGTHRDVLLSQRASAGTRSVPLGGRAARRGTKYAVVRVNATEVSIAEL
jgi:hypothetical protein